MYLSVNEIFASFQGEGAHTGFPTTFIRLAGCNLKCTWCDTRYALGTSDGKGMEIEDIVTTVKDLGLTLVCLTGGEPLVQGGSLDLVKELLKTGHRIDIETNGTIDISEYTGLGTDIMISMDVKPPSSGEDGSFLRANLRSLRSHDQLKFIVANEEDLEFSLAFLEKYHPYCHVIFTPVHNLGGDRIAELLLSKVIKKELSASIRLMVQSHKILWDPEKRGV